MPDQKRWLVLNPETGGHRVFDTQPEADALTEKHPAFRSYAMRGEFEVDEQFLNAIKWITEPSEGG